VFAKSSHSIFTFCSAAAAALSFGSSQITGRL
jgi:hypothetical protein